MSSRNQPNIVVLMTDDHRGTEMSHLPFAQAKTPHLDALAARGVSFAQAHCQGGMMGAVCVPSRASLMTGRNIFASSADPTGRHYATTLTIPRDMETFPEALRHAGYHTHAVGKWHNDRASFRRSFATGDMLLFAGMSDHHRVPISSYPESDGDTRSTEREGFSTDLFTDAAIAFLNRDHGDQPFLLYTAFTAPHDPRTPPPGWEVDPATIELPPNFLPEHPFDNGEMRVRDEMLAAHPRDPDEVRQHIADYDGMIAHLDHAIGRILRALDDNGLTDNTIVIYTGDHGLAVGQHGLMGKQNVYEHSTRIPLVMAGPGVPEGIVSDALVWHGDTSVTIRTLAGITPDDSLEGSPLVYDGNVTSGREYLGAAYAYDQRMIRDARYKLIRYWPTPDFLRGTEATPGTGTTQLFDLVDDPWETVNLAGNPGFDDVAQRLGEAMQAWQVEVGDELLKI